MFELADRLVGIYKTHDHTKSVTINPKLFQQSTGKKKDGAAEGEGEDAKEQQRVPLADTTNRMIKK
jgi:hypothetical protein